MAWTLAPAAVVTAVALTMALYPRWHSAFTRTPPGPGVAVQRGEATSAIAPQVKSTDTATSRLPVVRMRRRAPPLEQVPDFIERLTIAPVAVERLQVDVIAPPAAIEPSALDLTPLFVAPLGTEERPRE